MSLWERKSWFVEIPKLETQQRSVTVAMACLGFCKVEGSFCRGTHSPRPLQRIGVVVCGEKETEGSLPSLKLSLQNRLYHQLYILSLAAYFVTVSRERPD